MKSYVLGFCFDHNFSRVILIRKTRPSWQAGHLNGIGGHIEKEETPAQAIVREFKEETGHSVNLAWTAFGRLRGSEWEVYLFWSRYDFNVLRPHNLSEEGEVDAYYVSAVLEYQEAVPIPNLRYLVPMAINHALKLDQAEFFEICETKPPTE